MKRRYSDYFGTPSQGNEMAYKKRKISKSFRRKRRGNAKRKQYKKLRTKSGSKELNTQYERGSAFKRGGKKARMLKGISGKLLMADKPEVIVRCDEVQKQMYNYGKILCASYEATNNSAEYIANTYLPCHLYEMTAVPTIKADTGAGAGNIVQPQLRYNVKLDINKTPVIEEDVGQDFVYNTYEKGIGDSTGWATSNMGHNMKRCFLRYIEARLVLYQVRRVPMRYTMMFVKFKDRQLVPEQVKVGGQMVMSNAAKNFYTRLIKPYVNGTIARSDETNLRAGMQILQKKTIVMPEMNDTDSDFVKKTNVSLKLNLDKIHSFEWSNPLTGGGGTVAVPFTADPELGIVRQVAWNDRIKPEHRIYLIVLAESISHISFGDLKVSPDRVVSSKAGIDNTGFGAPLHEYAYGTYDLVLRAKYNAL